MISEASDERIEHMSDLRDELDDYSSDSDATPGMADLMVSLYEQERLYGPISEAYTFAAIEYNGVGDLWTSQKYARLAVEAGLLYGGPADKDVKQMQQLLKDPVKHWSWMLRLNQRMGGNVKILHDDD
jgi:hypothetical protein